jgi:hypothetical protein
VAHGVFGQQHTPQHNLGEILVAGNRRLLALASLASCIRSSSYCLLQEVKFSLCSVNTSFPCCAQGIHQLSPGDFGPSRIGTNNGKDNHQQRFGRAGKAIRSRSTARRQQMLLIA